MRDIGCARCILPVRDGIYFLCIWNSIKIGLRMLDLVTSSIPLPCFLTVPSAI